MRLGTGMHAISDFAQDELPIRQALVQVAEIGYQTIMLLDFPGRAALTAGSDPAGSLIDLGASDGDLVKEAVRGAGLEISAVWRGCVRVATDEEAAETLDSLKSLVRLTRELGCKIVLPNAGVAPKPGMATADKEELLRRLARVVMAALEDADADMRFALDIHYGGVVESVEDCGRFFELAQDTRAGVTLNIGHMTTCRQEGWLIPQTWPERVHVVAWKDHLLQPPPEASHAVWSVELGTGDSPFEKYVEVLKPLDRDWEHLITFEHVPMGQKKEALRRSREYLEGLWGG